MYIAMNRFKIKIGKESEFEQIWKSRETHLDKVDGFIKFNLIKGATNDDYTLYASHSIWNSESSFVGWTKSQSFREAHKNVGTHRDVYIGHPVFEGFKIII